MPQDSIASQLALAESIFGKTSAILGEGYNGAAYRMESGDVLKLTHSKLEATTTNFIRNLQSFDAFVSEGIVEYRSSAYEIAPGVFAYTMEYVRGVTREEASLIPKFTTKDDAEDVLPSNAFFRAYYAVHDEWEITDKRKKAKLHKRYLDSLQACSEVPGYETASEVIFHLATSRENGGPFLVGDYKPLNCGYREDGSGQVKAFDLYIYNIPSAAKYQPKEYK